MPAALKELRAQVEAAALAAVERAGPDGIDKIEIVRRFEAHGVSRSTVFRWLQALEQSGRAGQHLAKHLRTKAAQRAAEAPDPAAAVRTAAATALPSVPELDDIVGTGSTVGGIGAVDQLRYCMRAAHDVMEYARMPDGKVRTARMLLAASEHLRRNIETAVRLQGLLYQTAKVDEFHRAVLQVIEDTAKRHPDLAEGLVFELQKLAAQWMSTQ
jgi:transposase-like protein